MAQAAAAESVADHDVDRHRWLIEKVGDTNVTIDAVLVRDVADIVVDPPKPIGISEQELLKTDPILLLNMFLISKLFVTDDASALKSKFNYALNPRKTTDYAMDFHRANTVGVHPWSAMFPATFFVKDGEIFVVDGQQRLQVLCEKNTGERRVFFKVLRQDTPLEIALKIAQALNQQSHKSASETLNDKIVNMEALTVRYSLMPPEVRDAKYGHITTYFRTLIPDFEKRYHHVMMAIHLHHTVRAKIKLDSATNRNKVTENILIGAKPLRCYPVEVQHEYFDSVLAQSGKINRQEAIDLCRKVCFNYDLKMAVIKSKIASEEEVNNKKVVINWIKGVMNHKPPLYLDKSYQPSMFKSGTQKEPSPAVIPEDLIHTQSLRILQTQKRRQQVEELPSLDRNIMIPNSCEKFFADSRFSAPSFKFNVGFIDPPWGVRTEKEARDVTWGMSQTNQVAVYVHKHMAENGNFFYFLPESQISQTVAMFESAGLKADPVAFIWIKQGTTSSGTIKGAQAYAREYIVHITHGGQNDWFEAALDDAQLLGPKGSGLITVPVPRSHEVLKRHDSRDPWRIEQKPVRLLQYLLWMSVGPQATGEELVLDLCAGTATASAAAMYCGMRSIGVECDIDCCAAARDRLLGIYNKLLTAPLLINRFAPKDLRTQRHEIAREAPEYQSQDVTAVAAELLSDTAMTGFVADMREEEQEAQRELDEEMEENGWGPRPSDSAPISTIKRIPIGDADLSSDHISDSDDEESEADATDKAAARRRRRREVERAFILGEASVSRSRDRHGENSSDSDDESEDDEAPVRRRSTNKRAIALDDDDGDDGVASDAPAPTPQPPARKQATARAKPAAPKEKPAAASRDGDDGDDGTASDAPGPAPQPPARKEAAARAKPAAAKEKPAAASGDGDDGGDDAASDAPAPAPQPPARKQPKKTAAAAKQAASAQGKRAIASDIDEDVPLAARRPAAAAAAEASNEPARKKVDNGRNKSSGAGDPFRTKQQTPAARPGGKKK